MAKAISRIRSIRSEMRKHERMASAAFPLYADEIGTAQRGAIPQGASRKDIVRLMRHVW